MKSIINKIILNDGICQEKFQNCVVYYQGILFIFFSLKFLIIISNLHKWIGSMYSTGQKYGLLNQLWKNQFEKEME